MGKLFFVHLELVYQVRKYELLLVITGSWVQWKEQKLLQYGKRFEDRFAKILGVHILGKSHANSIHANSFLLALFARWNKFLSSNKNIKRWYLSNYIGNYWAMKTLFPLDIGSFNWCLQSWLSLSYYDCERPFQG